ncbi:MAG TPA: hypothetical protein VHE54_07660 [Puia sp.]|nr:hypothetical protein [Puia sp.]
MNNRLEQFVRDHREEFDSEEPDNKLWDKISAGMGPDRKAGKEPGSLPGEKKRGALVRFNPARWSAAAAVVLLIAAATWYFSTRSGNPGGPATQPIASNHLPKPDSTPSSTGTRQTDGSQTASSNPNPGADSQLARIRPQTTTEGAESDNSMDEEMYHYARLVEIKHNQLKAIEKDEPLLYKQFASDVNRLDSVYHSLQSQLPKNPNREQLLEAMLQNLQLQMGLLNHQLDVIKQINHSKKTEYEKAHKTI